MSDDRVKRIETAAQAVVAAWYQDASPGLIPAVEALADALPKAEPAPDLAHVATQLGCDGAADLEDLRARLAWRLVELLETGDREGLRLAHRFHEALRPRS